MAVVAIHKYLGYQIGNRLTFHDHTMKVRGRLASCRAALTRCAKYLNVDCLQLIANALASSHINFSHTILVISDAAAFTKLNSVYNSIRRILSNNGISWPDIQSRLITLNISLIVKTMNDKSAPYLKRYLKPENLRRRKMY